MRMITLLVAAVLIVAAVFTSPAADEIDDRIAVAEKLANEGDADGAVALLEKLTVEFPEDSDAMAYLGLYTGMGAGRSGDYAEAARLMMLSFERLDSAVRLDEKNPRAWLFRGIMGVKVPSFLGRLDDGISDLEKAASLYASDNSAGSGEGLVTSLTMLAEAYGAKEDAAGRRSALERIIRAAPDSEAAAAAKISLEDLSEIDEAKWNDTSFLLPSEDDGEAVAALKKAIAGDPEDNTLLLELGEAYYDEGSFSKARRVLKHYVTKDKTSPVAYKLLALSTAMVAGEGYDDKIHENTDYLSGLAFETMNNLDKAVELSPDDSELRLMRGTVGLLMPFFLGKHDQSVEDLEMVLQSEAPDSARAQALFYLGWARQREGLRYWIKAAKKYPGSAGAELAFGQMRPKIARIDESSLEGPYVRIEFELGFQDELAPQTAVWIERENEQYVATVYVSGFAGNVKEKQVTLPVWSAVSGHQGLDGITGASIDVGDHIYIWDLKDYEGKKVGKGTYKVRVETSYWPTMLYQNAEAQIEVGGKGNSVRIEEGDFIPYLEITYVK